MKSTLIIIFLCGVFLLSGESVAAQTHKSGGAPGKNEGALKALVKKMGEAQVNYDPATLEKIYASDYVEISPIGEYDPREKAIGFYKPSADSNRDNVKRFIESDEFTLRDYGAFAVATTRLTFKREVEGQSPQPLVRLRATVVFRREKGEWKIASVQYTGIRPPVSVKS